MRRRDGRPRASTYNRVPPLPSSACTAEGNIVLDLSIVFPAHNEQARLQRALDDARAYCRERRLDYEIIVVDDGSRDATREIVEHAARMDRTIRLVSLPENRGKGAAVRAGMGAASGRWILMSDVDLSTPLSELERLEPYRTKGEVIIGSRAVPGAQLNVRQPVWREWMGRTFNLLVRLVGLSGCHDTQCGFKLWSADAARVVFPQVKIDRFAFDVESLWLARACGFRVLEVPVRWNHDAGSRVNVPLDGARMVFDLLALVVRARLGPKPAPAPTRSP